MPYSSAVACVATIAVVVVILCIHNGSICSISWLMLRDRVRLS